VVRRTPLVVEARATAEKGLFRLSSSTVYPRTTVIRDAVVGNFIPTTGFRATGSIQTQDQQYRSLRREVVDGRGHVIASGAITRMDALAYDPGVNGWNCRDAGCGRFTWDGRDSSGRVVPAGTYRIRLVRGYDQAGNPRLLTPVGYVRVSTTKLVARTTSVTLAAADAQTLGWYGYDAPGDSEWSTPSVASDRYPGGRSYRSTTSIISPTGNTWVADQFILPVPGRRTASDTWSVTARGGPTTQGANGSGRLVAGAARSNRSLAVMEGDATASLSKVLFTSNTEVPLPGRPSGLRWSFSVDPGSSYDVASFDVSYTTYVPAS
jgi:hypothetical protein